MFKKLKDFWQKKPNFGHKTRRHRDFLATLRRFIRSYHRPLIISAVVFITLIFGRCYLLEGSFSEQEFLSEGDLTSSVYAGILGGPDDPGDGILVSQEQFAEIDFSQDDYLEDELFTLVQENSLLAPTSPDLPSSFGRVRSDILIYTVQAGDIPGVVANSFGLNISTFLWANNLKDGDLIRPGDQLVVLPINGVRIKIKSGDTIGSLSKKYGGKEEEIIAFNNLSEAGVLAAGEYLMIPGGEMPAPAPTYSAPKYASATQKAGWLIMPTSGLNWGRRHGYNAVDIASSCWTPVYAAAAGTISQAKGSGWNGGYGKYVKISHGQGTATLYAHFSQIIVSVGQEVGQGQLVGYMGTTGRSTGCHLHFEVHGATNPFIR